MSIPTNLLKQQIQTEKEMIHNSCEEDIDAVATRGNMCVEGRKKINEQL